MSVLLVLQICLGLIGFLIIWWFAIYFKYDRHLKKYPGPLPLPILGNLPNLGNLSELLESLESLCKRYGKIMKLWIGFDAPWIVLLDTKALEVFMSSSKVIDKSENYTLFHKWLGFGLITSTGTRWRKHRKILTPAFHFQILEQFVDVFNTYTDVLIEKLQKECGKASVDVYPYITLCVLDIICTSTMGTTVNAMEDADSEYVRSVEQICKIFMQRSLSVIKRIDFLYHFTGDYQIQKKALKVLHGYTNSVIRSRRKDLEALVKNEEDNYNESDFYKKKKKTFLDLLLQYSSSEYSLTDEDIRQEVDTFMFAGHDTTASAVSFTLYNLSNHQDVQEKAIKELRDIFNDDKSRKATYKDLQAMKYLEQVIKESLRLYPSVPIYGRCVTEDIEFDGTKIPKNCNIFFIPYILHRMPEYYPDPEKFDPERFTMENQAKRSAYAYIPFSAGPRNCIGQKFAMLKMKSVVSKVLRNYCLIPTNPKHNVKLVGETILKSSNGICMRLMKREF